jgi:hypothetical protein
MAGSTEGDAARCEKLSLLRLRFWLVLPWYGLTHATSPHDFEIRSISGWLRIYIEADQRDAGNAGAFDGARSTPVYGLNPQARQGITRLHRRRYRRTSRHYINISLLIRSFGWLRTSPDATVISRDATDALPTLSSFRMNSVF